MLSASTATSAAAPPVASPGYVIGASLGPTLSIHPATQSQNASAPYDPQQVQAAYGVNAITFNGIVGTGAGQTVAIVDAYNDPDIVSDTATFDTQFNLQQFNVANGPTFQVLNETGGTSLAGILEGQQWDIEESLDVEWVHSMAPDANIVLFEANTPNFSDMLTAEATAAGFAGVSVVSNSWGGTEFSGENQFDSTFTTPADHQGVTFLAGSGDHGEPGLYPAFSPNVVAVGGTNLQIQQNGAYISESVWNNNNTGTNAGSATGGGISTQEAQPSYQAGKVNGISTTQRLSADVSADADPDSGVFVYDSFSGGWFDVGGTSLATPLWGGMIAIANQGRVLAGEGTLNGPTQTLPMLYNLPSSDFNDITVGNNGTYSAGVGYDIPTGLGTPIANLLIPALAGYGPNQPPSVTAPSSAGVTENSSLTFSTANSNAISVTDVSAGSNADSLTLSVSNGTLTLGATTGLTFTSGSNDSASFTVSGTIANLDAGLSGLVYQPTNGYLGSDTLSVSVTDPGNSQTTAASVSLSVVPPVTGTWTAMTNVIPNGDGGQLSLLLPDGQLLVHGLGNGSGNSPEWYLVTPNSSGSYINGTWTVAGSMNVGRLYFASDVLPNDEVFVVGGEYATDESLSNSAEIYNPATNVWTTVASDPQSNVGDEPSEVLSDGNILVGNIFNNGTEIYDPTTNVWTSGPTKIRDDQSDEESWVKLPNGDILTYDLFSSINDNNFEAELYNPTTNAWTDASTTIGTIPLLSTAATGDELGPALLLPDGQALFTGTNGTTALFNPSNDTWTQGPQMPSVMINGVLTQLTTGDAPGAVLPNGDVVLALSPAVFIDNTGEEQFPAPTYIYDFNPTADVWTNISPSSTIDPNLSARNSYVNTMLILPTGQLLLNDDSNQLAIYTPTSGSPQDSWKPVVTSFTKNPNGTSYTLTGEQLNGLDEGAAYGDDNQMAENYPIVQLTDTSNGHILYATTSDWSSVGVATGTETETVTVTMPTALGNDPFTLEVIADGIASNVYSQAPVFAAPNAVTVNEDSTLSFTGNNTISLSDGFGTAETTSLSVSHGTLSMTGTGVSNSGTGTVTFTGTLSALNSALATLTYTPTTGYNGSDKLSLSDTDTGDSLNGIGSVAITVSPVAPSIAAPAPVVVPMNGTLPFAGVNVIAVSDISGTTEQMTLSVSHGTLVLSTTGLTSSSGNGTASVSLTGSLSVLNGDLATLIYTPTAGYSGGDTLKLSVEDTTDSLSGTASVSITVESAPAISGPSSVTVTENSTLTFSSANHNQITVADLFADGAFEALSLSVSQGILTLGSTNGVNITNGSDGSSSMTLTGTVDNLNAALNGLVYQPNLNSDVSDALAVLVNNPADGLTGSSSVVININALAPTVAAPPAVTVKENTSLTFSTGNGNAITVGDINGGGDSLALSASHGTLTLASTSGLTFTTGANGSASFVVTGSLSNLSAALNGLFYQPTTNYAGSDSLTASITNLTDGKSASTTVSVSVVPAPTVAGPSTATVTENTSLTFVAGFGNEITVTDTAAVGNSDSLTLSVSDGRLTLGGETGLTFTSGTNDSASFTINGTIGELNAALNGLNYQPNVGYTGSDTLTLFLDDAGDNLTTTGSVLLSVNPVVPPVITAPATESLSENGSLTFSTTNGKSISVADNGAGINADTETLSVSSGTLTLATTNGLIFLAGSNGAASFTVKGTVSNFNAALNGLDYVPRTGYAGSDSLLISVADSTDSQSNSSSVALTVLALPPAITAPLTASLIEGGSLAFLPGNGNTISLSDATTGSDSLTLGVTHGTLTLATTSGLTFTTGANGTASFTVSGTVTNLNAALNGLVYQPTAAYTGSDTLGISVLDPGDNQTASARVSLTINTAPAPAITAPATGSVLENASLVFSSTNNTAIVVTDAAAGPTTDSLTLSVAHGTLTLAATNGLTFTAGANGTASFTVIGSVANLNAALVAVTYRPASGYVGSDSLHIAVSDSGDNESGSTIVALTVVGSIAPSITAPTGAVVSENGAIAFSSATNNAIAVADSGSGSNSDSLILTATHGTVALATTTGLTITAGANGSASITVTGSVANLNAALNGLLYEPNTGYTGSDTLAISIKDSADSQSTSASVALSVNAGNAPSIKAPATVASKFAAVVFSGSQIAITDNNAGSNIEELSLRTSSGTLTLASTTGITFISGANGTALMLIEGTLTNLNAALNGLSLTLASKTGTVTLAYFDLGNKLSGTAVINVSQSGGVSTGPGPLALTSGTTNSLVSSTPPDAQTQDLGFAAAVEMLVG